MASEAEKPLEWRPSQAALDEWGRDAEAFQRIYDAGHLDRYLAPSQRLTEKENAR